MFCLLKDTKFEWYVSFFLESIIFMHNSFVIDMTNYLILNFDDPGPYGASRYSDHTLPEVLKLWREKKRCTGDNSIWLISLKNVEILRVTNILLHLLYPGVIGAVAACSKLSESLPSLNTKQKVSAFASLGFNLASPLACPTFSASASKYLV